MAKGLTEISRHDHTVFDLKVDRTEWTRLNTLYYQQYTLVACMTLDVNSNSPLLFVSFWKISVDKVTTISIVDTQNYG